MNKENNEIFLQVIMYIQENYPGFIKVYND